jgi:hypothetical protein
MHLSGIVCRAGPLAGTCFPQLFIVGSEYTSLSTDYSPYVVPVSVEAVVIAQELWLKFRNSRHTAERAQ